MKGFLTRIDKMFNILVNSFYPNSQTDQSNHLILKSYFLLNFLIASILILLKTFHSLSRSYSTNSSNHPNFIHHPSIIDIFIDLNSFFDHPHSIHSILSHVKSLIIKNLPTSSINESNQFVFWCYISHSNLDQNLINQLNTLEINCDLGSIQVRKSDENNEFNSFQLILDSIKLMNISIPNHLFIISTSDLNIYKHGAQLLKSHPSSPSLCFITPPSFKMTSKLYTCHADYLLPWDENHHSSSKFITFDLPNSSPSDQYFKPLILFLKSLGSAEIKLQRLIVYLEPWTNQLSSDQEIDEYFDLAFNQGIIIWSDEVKETLSLSETLQFSDKLTKSSDQSINQSNLQSSEKNLTTEDDPSTTTASDSELDLPSSSLNPHLSSQLIEPLIQLSNEINEKSIAHDSQARTKQEQIRSKNKQSASSFSSKLERPTKRNKNQDSERKIPSTLVSSTKSRRKISKTKQSLKASNLNQSESPMILFPSVTSNPVNLDSQSRSEHHTKPPSIRLSLRVDDQNHVTAFKNEFLASSGLGIHNYNKMISSHLGLLSPHHGALSVNLSKGEKNELNPRSAHENFKSLLSPSLVRTGQKFQSYPFPEDEMNVD
ncbi:hypothetical protein O181_074813 [Austropuccinia psidii MF-1]|uniref:Uncharacterized protein n=1 Tax=Austropuccinia psidii MF-1 TaxID=1389203 RepID=A0A9Q3F7M6_9BASI|nr:hypothetical protein [Austropuccinia psidii MF-1]